MRRASRKIVVAGGTGALGRLTSQFLGQYADVAVSAMSRSGNAVGDIPGVAADLLSGSGLSAAVSGAQAVIWCAHDRAAHENEAQAMRNLLNACSRAGVGNLVYTGIIGIETSLASPYYKGKLMEEQAIEASGVAHTILRAAQFHDLVLNVLDACDDGSRYLVPKPLMLRPVDIATVAQRLACLALEPPCGRAPDLAGPEDLELADMARMFCRITRTTKPVVETADVPARWASLQTLTHGPADRAGPTFEEWLRARQQA